MTFDDCSEADWRKLAEKALAGAPFEQLVSHSEDGVAYGPVHGAAEVRPLLRGSLAPWSIAQRLDDPDSARANAQAMTDLDGGADALVVVLENAPSAHGFGLPRDELRTALDGVMLGIVHLRIESGDAAGLVTDELRALADEQRLTVDMLDLDLCIDPLGPLALAGKFPADDVDLGEALGEQVETHIGQGFCGRLFEADGRVYHEAGASEAQELGAVLASAVYALRIMENCGETFEYLPTNIGFTLAADQKQFHVMAKLRALRLLWQRVQMLSGISSPAPARIHVETARRMMAAADPHTNILRTTIAAFAAAAGGADRIAVLSFTSANGLPEAKARRLARNTQLILRDEAGLGHVADPASGSGGIEALTTGLSAAAWREFQQIEREGGLFASLRDGQLQRRIRATAATRTEAVADKREPIIGVSLYPPAVPRDVTVLMPRPTFALTATSGVDPLLPIRLSEALEPAR